MLPARFFLRMPLLAVALCAQSQGPADRGVTTLRRQLDVFQKEPRVAVVVGVDDYRHSSGFRKLDYAAKDADSIAQALEGGDFKYKVVKKLNTEAIRTELREAFTDASAMLSGKGTLLFFFAGHGAQQDGKQYLALYETGADELNNSGLYLSEVRDLMNASHAARKILMIDACRNDPGTRATRGADEGLRRFGRLEESQGLRILNATAANQVSYEDPKLGHGVFTSKVLEGLDGKAADRFGLVTFNGLAEYVTGAVRDYSYATGHFQNPYETGDASGDFLLGGTLKRGQDANASPAPSAAPADLIRDAFERARKSPNRIEMLRAFTVLFPDSPYSNLARIDLAAAGASPDKALFEQGLAFLDRGDNPLAIAVLDKVLRNEPGNLDAAAYYAWALGFDLAYPSAIDVADAVLRRQPGNLVALFARGYSNARLRNIAASKPDLIKVTASQPTDARGYRVRANAHSELFEFDAAIRDFNQALKMRPSYSVLYNERGNAYIGAQQLDKATEDYSEAIRLLPHNPVIITNRGSALYFQRQFDLAMRDFEEAIRLRPDYALALNGRGNIYFNRQQYEKAIQDFSEAIRLQPGSALAPDTLTNRADAEVHLQRYDAAIRDCSDAIAMRRDSLRSYEVRAQAEEANGDTTGAARDRAVIAGATKK